MHDAASPPPTDSLISVHRRLTTLPNLPLTFVCRATSNNQNTSLVCRLLTNTRLNLIKMSTDANTAVPPPTAARKVQGTGKGKGKGKGGNPGKKTTRSTRAGLQFPVGRLTRFLRKNTANGRIGQTAGVYTAAVMEYLCAELLELAGKAARDNKRTRIAPRHLMMAVRNDEELNILLGSVTIAAGGVLPNIHQILLPKGRTKDASQAAQAKTTEAE